MTYGHELICQVDEADRIVGPCLRDEAHRLGLRHRAVHILVFNPKGEVLLQKRSLNKDVHPGLWDTSAAGHVDFGESYDDCAKRELAEELGIEVDEPLHPLFKVEAEAENGWEFVQVYQMVHQGEIRIEAEAIDDARWFSIADLEIWMESGGDGLTPSLQALWRKFRSL